MHCSGMHGICVKLEIVAHDQFDLLHPGCSVSRGMGHGLFHHLSDQCCSELAIVVLRWRGIATGQRQIQPTEWQQQN